MKEFEKWFKKAEVDLIMIQNVIHVKDAPYDLCCFHAQQASEKYLKAYLIAKNIAFPYTHNLITLLLLCKHQNDNFKKIEKNCEAVTDFGISPRYPDDIDDLTFDDAKKAYEDAIAIKAYVITHFFD